MSLRYEREVLKRELHTYNQLESLRHKFKTDKGYKYVVEGKKSDRRENRTYKCIFAT